MMTLLNGSTALYTALAFYAAGTLSVLVSLSTSSRTTPRIAVGLMVAGFVAHTVWIGTICTRTGHPPLTNLPEATTFLSWTILAGYLVLFLKFKIEAAAFFIFPLVFLLLSIPALITEPFAQLDPSLRSNLFTAHLLFTLTGVAALLLGLAFSLLYYLQERALRLKSHGRFLDRLPSLRLSEVLSFRGLATGFALYTAGLLAGVLWDYRKVVGTGDGFRWKEAGALLAWILFAAILQSYRQGTYRTQRHLLLSGAAFLSIVIAIFGIQHV